MSLVWLPIKLLLGGVTLVGAATLGYGLGALTGSVATSWPTRNKAVASAGESAEAGQLELPDAV